MGSVNAIVPSGVRAIGRNAFTKCVIKCLEIPNSVTTLEYAVFSYLRRDVYVWVPSSVVNISERLNDNTSLKMYCEANSQPAGWNSNWNTGSGTIVYWGSTFQDYLDAIENL